MCVTETEKKKIDQFFKEHQKEILEDLKTLVEIPSVVTEGLPGRPYGSACRQVLDTAARISRRMGFFVKEVDDCCMTAELGGREAKLCLLAHLDVVDAGEGWTKAPISDGRNWGRMPKRLFSN